MPIVRAKPTSPGRRFVEKVVHPHLYKGRPYAALLESKSKVVVVVTTMAVSPLVISVVVISNIIVLSISNVLKTISQQR